MHFIEWVHQPEDLDPLLAEPYAKYYRDDSPLHEPWTTEAVAYLLDYFHQKQPDLFWVAYENNKPVGFIVSFVKPCLDGYHLVDTEVFVRQDLPLGKRGFAAKKLTLKLLETAFKRYSATAIDGNTYKDPNKNDFPFSMYMKMGMQTKPIYVYSGSIPNMLETIEQGHPTEIVKQTRSEISKGNPEIEIKKPKMSMFTVNNSRTKDDICVLADAYTDYYNHTHHVSYKTEQASQSLCEFFMKQPDLFFIAYDKTEKPIGFIMSLAKPWHDGFNLTDTEIFIIPDLSPIKKALAAKALTQTLLHAALEEYKATTIVGNVHANDKDLQNILEKMGMERDPELLFVTGNVLELQTRIKHPQLSKIAKAIRKERDAEIRTRKKASLLLQNRDSK